MNPEAILVPEDVRPCELQEQLGDLKGCSRPKVVAAVKELLGEKAEPSRSKPVAKSVASLFKRMVKSIEQAQEDAGSLSRQELEEAVEAGIADVRQAAGVSLQRAITP